MKRFTAILAILLLLALCGCETMKGLGKDFQKLGGWMEEKAD